MFLCCFLSSNLPHMYESFEPWHLRDNYKVKQVHAHSPPLSFFLGEEVTKFVGIISLLDRWNQQYDQQIVDLFPGNFMWNMIHFFWSACWMVKVSERLTLGASHKDCHGKFATCNKFHRWSQGRVWQVFWRHKELPRMAMVKFQKAFRDPKSWLVCFHDPYMLVLGFTHLTVKHVLYILAVVCRCLLQLSFMMNHQLRKSWNAVIPFWTKHGNLYLHTPKKRGNGNEHYDL